MVARAGAAHLGPAGGAVPGSRIPYGIAVTPERLRQIETAELGLRALGFRDFRVRHHDGLARLEVHPAEIARVAEHRREIAKAVRAAGFRRVLIDLQGYRRGSLNEGLAGAQLVQLGAPGERVNGNG